LRICGGSGPSIPHSGTLWVFRIPHCSLGGAGPGSAPTLSTDPPGPHFALRETLSRGWNGSGFGGHPIDTGKPFVTVFMPRYPRRARISGMQRPPLWAGSRHGGPLATGWAGEGMIDLHTCGWTITPTRWRSCGGFTIWWCSTRSGSNGNTARTIFASSAG
jgi:hypothetical protein